MTDRRPVADVVRELSAAAETLAAVGVYLSVMAGEQVVPVDVERRVAAVTSAVGDVSDVDRAQARSMAAVARAILGQAAAFIADPLAPPNWSVSDTMVLQSLGQASASFAPLIRRVVAPQLEGCLDALNDNGTILDVGVGVAALAIALADTFPAARIVGLDVWLPALELARTNVNASGAADRIELREQDVCTLTDRDRFDLVWFAGPFIPAAVVDTALTRCASALKPGGWLLFASFRGADPLGSALADLRTHRSGGPVLDVAAVIELLASRGLVDGRAIALDAAIPSGIVAARRPQSAK